MQEVIIAAAARTAIGDFGGTIKYLGPMELARHIMQAVTKRAPIQTDWIDKVIMGCCFAPIEQNVARNAAFKAGFPKETPAFTINSTCGSSMQAVICAMQSIMCGESRLVLAGGVESMSSAPYISSFARWGQRLRHAEMYDLLWRGMQEPSIGVGMGITAENLAAKYGITRAEQDAFALLSHTRAAAAIKSGKFRKEIVPLALPARKGKQITFDTDEHVRPETRIEDLANLPPIFKKDGTVTAGNACGMNDAAAALVLADRESARVFGLEPLARIRAYQVSGVDPDYMGIGPVPAIQGTLKRGGVKLSDIDRFEINEAFAAQYLACEKELELDRDKANVYGNGIALGHPVGATGCRLLVTLLHQLIDDDLNLGIASLCAGGGMGFSILIERI